MKSKLLLTSLIIVAILICLGGLIVKTARYYQKDTCRKTIEYSVVAQIHLKKLRLETILNNDWKQINSVERERFWQYVKENEDRYTECSDYKYLINGKDADQTNVPISARLDDFNSVEIRLDE